ncbi:MAG: Fe-S cluster assembly protein SufD [Myxococcales bacterium]|nr:Fe-S cluster assembly protein SufD [Myxococcales bacterium]
MSAQLTPLAELRATADGLWQSNGLPSPKLEAWKHTNLRALQRVESKTGGTVATEIPSEFDAKIAAPLDGFAGTLLLVDGKLNLALSVIPDGLTVVDLADAAPEQLGTIAKLDRLQDGLTARNLAQFDRGVALSVTGHDVGAIELRYVQSSEDAAMATQESRLLIELARHAELTVVERHIGAGQFVNNHVTEVDLSAGAVLKHVRVQHQDTRSFHLGKIAVRQGRDSRYESHVAQFGAAIGRCDIEVFLAEPGASCKLDGLYHGQGNQHIDNHSVIHHIANNTTSSELYKGILDDKSTGIFRGNILIYKGASGCATTQMNRNLVLSEQATVHTKPQLEIDNDDVTAAHGATVGQLDDDALFYLRSRGIDAQTAHSMLVFAFAGEVVADVPVESIQTLLKDELARRLAARTGLTVEG